MEVDKLKQLNEAIKLWDHFTFNDKVGKHLESWRTPHNELLTRAKQKPPASRAANVSSFTDWIYDLYAPNRSLSGLLTGTEKEPLVEIKRKADAAARNRWKDSMCKLIYRGMGDDPDDPLTISKLRINGICVQGRPDLAFQNKKTGEILIVEVKVSDAHPPDGGWPNLRAQLWAYSLADRFSDAPRVHVGGEVWRTDLSRLVPIKIKSSGPHWHIENEQLFRAFGGDVVA